MRFGFLFGAIFGIWLTLTYPEQMSDAFGKLTDIFLEFKGASQQEIVPPE